MCLNYSHENLNNCALVLILNYKNAAQLDMKSLGDDSSVSNCAAIQYKGLSYHFHVNYNKLYNQLIERSRVEKRQRNQGVYYENHHIIPRCIGGTNDPENLVLLTAREHFIAHWILTKLYPNEPGMIFAFNCFNRKLHGAINQTGLLDDYSTSRNYERARIKVVELMKTNVNPFREYNKTLFGTTYVNDGKISKRIKKDELQLYLDDGWNKGRKRYKRKSPSLETRNKISNGNSGKKCSEEHKEKLRQYSKNYPHVWVSKNGESSQIFEKDISKYLEDGWVRGRHSLRSKQPHELCYFRFNNIFVKVDIEFRNAYQKYGWQECTEQEYLNREKDQLKSHTVFKYWVNKDNKSFRVCYEELPVYKYLGYNTGRGRRRFL